MKTHILFMLKNFKMKKNQQKYLLFKIIYNQSKSKTGQNYT